MKVERKGKELVITIAIEKPSPSKSGKSLVVCSSRGVCTLPIKVAVKALQLVINGFIYREERKSVATNKNQEPPKEDVEEE